MVDIQAQQFLKLLEDRASTHELSVAENRQRATAFQQFAGEKISLAAVENRQISVADGSIGIRIYRASQQEQQPIFIYIHGGGWVLGDLETADAPCRQIAALAKCIVVSIDYRLAPEYPFPTPIRDCYAAIRWIKDNAKTFGGDEKRLIIGGDSAGGNLTAVITQLARERKDVSFLAQVLLYPVTDTALNTASYEENAEGYFLTKSNMEWFIQQYVPENINKKDPLIAPLNAEDFTSLPPALVVLAQYDPLRDEGMHYAEKLKQANVPVKVSCYEGMIHGFFWMPGLFSKGQQAIHEVAQFSQKYFSI